MNFGSSDLSHPPADLELWPGDVVAFSDRDKDDGTRFRVVSSAPGQIKAYAVSSGHAVGLNKPIHRQFSAPAADFRRINRPGGIRFYRIGTRWFRAPC